VAGRSVPEIVSSTDPIDVVTVEVDMRSIRPLLSLALAVSLVCVVPAQIPLETEGNYGIGSPDVFLPKYLGYRAQQLASSSPDVMKIRLGYVKGLSTTFTALRGEVAVNLASGTYQVSLNGLTVGQTYSVWLVDRPESDLIPPEPDTVFSLATVLALAPSTLLTGVLGLNLPLGFTIDGVVVAPGILWGAEPLAAGTVNVFQKMFFRRVSLVNDSTGAILFAETTPAPSFSFLVPDLAAETDALIPATSLPILGLAAPSSAFESASTAGSSGSPTKLDRLISQGAKLFFEGQFRGNGRTCGTCHPARNNFMIDADFIATLPPNDPLFVAEFNPALAGLERPALMRSDGLILENVDGFDAPTSKFVMRGVPHTLGLQVSLQRDVSLVNPSAPAEMTGWSGDGAPGTGSLNEFAIGAVTQHFTKNLARRRGVDFELPSAHQLDAMEAFQLSLGRSEDFILDTITFRDENLNTGKSLFINGGGDPVNAGGTCNFCHSNGGALSVNGQNRNFNTNVEDLDHPARPEVEDFPSDGGFGRALNSAGTFGNQTFNTAPVVEAADTPPFFHNNAVRTLDEAVAFYSGPEFNNDQRPGAARFNFNGTQNLAIADFLGALNTLQNIDVALREVNEALLLTSTNEIRTRLQTAIEDTQDAIGVLTERGLFPDARTELNTARNLLSQAQVTGDLNQRRELMRRAITDLQEAKDFIATIAP
jgi:cytochrome c peroxidase